MRTRVTHGPPALTALLAAVPAALAAAALTGCSAADVGGFSLPGFGRTAAADEPADPYGTLEVQGPLERLVNGKAKAVRYAVAVPKEARDRFETARRLYDQGEYGQAEKEFKSLARRYADTELEEDAQFWYAESLFARRRYSWAQDAYGDLLERYPSTRHTEDVSARLFTIARSWLNFPEVVTGGDVKTVNFERPDLTPPPKPSKPEQPAGFDPTRAVPLLPNLHDPSRPVFDTEGRALNALRTIWLNDPTGKLADDALMLTASHHLRRGDYLEADRTYQILRDEYPDSPHLSDAYALGSHVKLMSYQGPAYSGASLAASRDLKEDTLRLFPDGPEKDRLRDELLKIREATADQRMADVRLYCRKGNDKATALAARRVMREFPNSRAAGEARRIYGALPASARSLAELAVPLPSDAAAPPVYEPGPAYEPDAGSLPADAFGSRADDFDARDRRGISDPPLDGVDPF